MKTSNHLEKLFPNTRGGGRGYESKELLRVGAGESSAPTTTDTNTSFATSSTTKQTVAEIWGLKTCGKSHSRFSFFFHVKSRDFRFVTWFMAVLKADLPRLSFEVFRTKTKTELF